MRLLKVPTWDFELSLVVCAGHYSSAARCKPVCPLFFLWLLLVFQNHSSLRSFERWTDGCRFTSCRLRSNTLYQRYTVLLCNDQVMYLFHLDYLWPVWWMVDTNLTRNQTDFSCHFIAVLTNPYDPPSRFIWSLRIKSTQQSHYWHGQEQWWQGDFDNDESSTLIFPDAKTRLKLNEETTRV